MEIKFHVKLNHRIFSISIKAKKISSNTLSLIFNEQYLTIFLIYVFTLQILLFYNIFQKMITNNSNKINSIEELLSYFKNTKRHFFYLGPINSTTLLTIPDFIPNFQFLGCNDPYFGQLPFISVPSCVKPDHKCLLSVETACQNMLLGDSKVIEYMKAKDPTPNLILKFIDEETVRLCNANGIHLWYTTVQLFNFLGNKVEVIKLLQKCGIPYIPNICTTIQNYQHFQKLAAKLGSDKLVVQAQQGTGGAGTMFVNSYDDYHKIQHILQNGEIFKIMPFKRLKSFSIDAALTKTGTFIGPLFAELIGHKQLTIYRGGYCGNQLRSSYFEDRQIDLRIRREIYHYTQKFGNYLYGFYKGSLGFDFVVDMDTYEVSFMEINPRLTGPILLTYEFYQAQGHRFPHFLFHAAEHMGLELNLDAAAFNQEWIGTDHYQDEASILYLTNLDESEEGLPFTFPAGFWKLQNNEVVQVKKYKYKIVDLEEDEIFFTPNKGFSKASMAIRKRVQDYNSKLTNEAREMIVKFAEYRLRDKLAKLA